MKHLKPFRLNENFSEPEPDPGIENERRARASAYAYGGYHLSNASVTAQELKELLYAQFPPRRQYAHRVICKVDALHNTLEIQVGEQEDAVLVHELLESEPVRAYKDDENDYQDDDYATVTPFKYH